MFRLISVYPSDCPGNVFTRAVARERVYQSGCPGKVLTKRLPRERGYRASIQPQNGCIKGAVRQSERGSECTMLARGFASLPEQRRAFLLVLK
jgi:hypothetical protein